jgi:hypothetical protein
MAKIVVDAEDAIEYLNSLLELDDDVPSSGDEDFTVWLSLLNIGVNLWESEEGVLWRELFVKLADAATGDKTATAGDYSYATPTDFVFPTSGYVWIGTGTNKTAFKVVKQEDIQLYENNSDNWCYFLMDGTPTLEFNPNCNVPNGTISYNYYKNATRLTAGASTFEMSDPLFAVYYALSELTKEEGNQGALSIASQKMEGMKTRNIIPSYFQEDSFLTSPGEGFGN